MDAFARDVGALATFAAGDFVDFVEEDDAAFFNAIDGRAGDLVHVDELLLFFLNEVFEGFEDAEFLALGTRAEEVGDHLLEVDVHVFEARHGGDFEARPRVS